MRCIFSRKSLVRHAPWLRKVFLVSFCLFVDVRIPLLDGKGVEKAKENLRARYVATMTANYMLWPAAQVMPVCYGRLPFPRQPLLHPTPLPL